jgi:hypothetical protein
MKTPIAITNALKTTQEIVLTDVTERAHGI